MEAEHRIWPAKQCDPVHALSLGLEQFIVRRRRGSCWLHSLPSQIWRQTTRGQKNKRKGVEKKRGRSNINMFDRPLFKLVMGSFWVSSMLHASRSPLERPGSFAFERLMSIAC